MQPWVEVQDFVWDVCAPNTSLFAKDGATSETLLHWRSMGGGTEGAPFSLAEQELAPLLGYSEEPLSYTHLPYLPLPDTPQVVHNCVFSGIGVWFDASAQLGFKPRWACELDCTARKLLKHFHKSLKITPDYRSTDWNSWNEHDDNALSEKSKSGKW